MSSTWDWLNIRLFHPVLFTVFFNVLILIVKYSAQQDSLDQYLLGSNGIIITPAACTPPFVVSKQMEQLVIENFEVIKDFEEGFQTIYKQASLRRSVDEPLLNRFRGIIDRVCICIFFLWTWYILFLPFPHMLKDFVNFITVDFCLFIMNYIIISVLSTWNYMARSSGNILLEHSILL